MVAPAKGRISERIDENNNRTDYDHREIKFIRYDNGAVVCLHVINDNGNASGEFLTFVQKLYRWNCKR
jgi:predicted esterase